MPLFPPSEEMRIVLAHCNPKPKGNRLEAESLELYYESLDFLIQALQVNQLPINSQFITVIDPFPQEVSRKSSLLHTKPEALIVKEINQDTTQHWPYESAKLPPIGGKKKKKLFFHEASFFLTLPTTGFRKKIFHILDSRGRLRKEEGKEPTKAAQLFAFTRS